MGRGPETSLPEPLAAAAQEGLSVGLSVSLSVRGAHAAGRRLPLDRRVRGRGPGRRRGGLVGPTGRRAVRPARRHVQHTGKDDLMDGFGYTG